MNGIFGAKIISPKDSDEPVIEILCKFCLIARNFVKFTREPRAAKIFTAIQMSSVNLPEFVLYPPMEESIPLPCLCWLPDDNTITPLLNPSNNNDISLMNSILQLVVQLPELNQELPIDSQDLGLASFTKLVVNMHQKQCDEELVIKARQVFAKVEDGFKSSLLNLDSRDSSDTVVNKAAAKPKMLFANLVDLLLKTRFGSRFKIDSTHGNYLSVDLKFSHSRPVALVELLNSVFQIPTFFNGGKPIPEQQHQPLLLQLPHFLTIVIDRHLETGLSDTCLEVPFELDFNKYTKSKPKTQYKYKGSATFYKLHSFVTQKDGHFMLYSRVRSGKNWYKIDDENIEQVELGWQVQSRGVCLLLYRLQDQ